MALNFSFFLCPPEPLLQYPCARAQLLPPRNFIFSALISGRQKEPKPKLFGPVFFQWGRGLPREWVGAKKFDTSLETREIKLFGRDIPGFCRDIPGAPEKFEKKKKFVFNFRFL